MYSPQVFLKGAVAVSINFLTASALFFAIVMLFVTSFSDIGLPPEMFI